MTVHDSHPELLTLVFGEWDAGITEGAKPIRVPTHMSCMHCHERFVEGDNGAVMPTGYAQHRECALRSVIGGIGHVLDHDLWCTIEGDPDGTIGKRASAILVWQLSQGMLTLEEAETQFAFARGASGS